MYERLRILAIVGGLLALGLASLVELENPLAWAVIPLLISGAWMLGSPKKLLAGYWIYSSFVEYAYQLTRYEMLRFGDEALLGLIIVAIVFDQALTRRQVPDLKWILIVFWALLVLFGLSFVVNGGTPIKVAVTAVQYFRPFILGYLAYVALRPEDLPGACGLYLITMLAQLVLNTLWFLDINIIPHPGVYVGVDFAAGTMGNSLFVGYTACIGIILCVATYATMRRAIYMVLAAFLLISCLLTDTAHAYLFLAVMLLICVLLPARRPLTQIAAGVGGLILLGSLGLLLSWLIPNQLSLERYVQRGQDLFQGRKMAAYRMFLTEFHRDVPVLLLGAGPANLGAALADERSYLAAKYHGWTFTRESIMEQSAGSIISHTRTGLLTIWSDLGPVAFLLYWGVHIYAMIRVTRAYRRNAYQLPWQKTLALSFVPTMTFYLMVAFMADLIHTALWGFLPWVWAATVWTPVSVQEEPVAEAQSVVVNEATGAQRPRTLVPV